VDDASGSSAAQLTQVVAVNTFTAPQCGHSAAWSFTPHALQNFEFGGLTFSQNGHCLESMVES